MKLYHTFSLLSPGRDRFRTSSFPFHLPRFLLAERYQPRFVRRCPVTQAFCATLRRLDWDALPATLAMQPAGERTVPLAAYIASYLLKLDRGLRTFGELRRFLREHPALVWSFGFPLTASRRGPGRIDAEMCLPSQRHFAKRLSTLPNEIVQLLLDGQVAWLCDRFGDTFGDVVSLDTKHIIAWVKENNPKVFIKEGRFDKDHQPAGDLDCKLGCKRSHNRVTPTKEGQPADRKVNVGEFYWGYASGVVATKVPGVGEFVLAECTRTFDHSDVSYFFPLMAQVEQRLGRRPRYGTADAAYDAFYIYDYFHSDEHDGFAAVPKRDSKVRAFNEDGQPLCEAGLPMHLKSTFTNRTSLVQHKRGRYRCPLLHPRPTEEDCPINHAKWPDGGCQLTMPTAPGARIRHQLDRDSERYRAIYNQRTAVERIFSQAVALGIERPKLRNQQSIANLATLSYVLINNRAMQQLD